MSNGTRSSDTRGNKTKAALLEAAKRLIRERGYAGTTVREIAATAGVGNLAAVNYHFGSRENLLTEAMLASFVEWAERVGESGPVDPLAGPHQQLAARARPTVDGIPAMQPLFVVALEAILQAQRSPELKRRLAEHYAGHRQRAIEGMRAAGSPLPDRMLEVGAAYMIAVVDGLQLQALLDPDVIPTGDELAFMYEALGMVARAEGAEAAAATSPEDAATSPENDSL
jgi:AcrR family transcriptional regulator